MAILDTKEVTKPESILYTPVLNTKPVDLRLYTPDPQEPLLPEFKKDFPDPDTEKLDTPLYTPDPTLNDLEVPITIPEPDEEKLSVPLYTPSPDELKLKIPLYLPNPEEIKFLDILNIPNPNEFDFDNSVILIDPLEFKFNFDLYIFDLRNLNFDLLIPILDLSELEMNPYIIIPEIEGFLFNPDIMILDLIGIDLDQGLYTPYGIFPRTIPNYAYAIPFLSSSLKYWDWSVGVGEKSFYDTIEDDPLVPDLRPTLVNTVVNIPSKLPPAMNIHPLSIKDLVYNDSGIEKWQKLYAIQLKNVYSETVEHGWGPFEIKYTTYKYKNRTRPFDKSPYMSYTNNTGLWGGAKKVPNPSYKNKKFPVSQGWGEDAWLGRWDEFTEDAKSFFTEDLPNAALEMAKDFGTELFSSLFTFDTKKLSNHKVNNEYEKYQALHRYYKRSEHEDSTVHKKDKLTNYPWNPTDYKILSKKDKLKTDHEIMMAHIPVIGIFGGRVYDYELTPNPISDYPSHLYNYYNPSPEPDSWTINSVTKQSVPDKKLFNNPNHPINLINSIGPDFMKHKFSAYFIWYDENYTSGTTDFSDEKGLTAFQKHILSKDGFGVRFGTLSIPQVSKEEFKVLWLENAILKPKSTINVEKKASFSLRLDQNLFWLDFVDKLSGHNNTLNMMSFEINPAENLELNPFSTKRQSVWTDTINCISNSFLTNYSKKLCLVVEMIHLSNVRTVSQVDILPYFVFEDIKITGTSASINYNREGGSPQDITISFIYKNLVETYIPKSKYDKKYFDKIPPILLKPELKPANPILGQRLSIRS